MTVTSPKIKISRVLDIKGRLFGSLTVLHKVRTAKGKKQQWRCRCVCGVVLTTRHDYLLHTNTPKTSCGCLNKGNSVLHREEYHIHNSMLQRCYTVSHVAYKSYGGRGISVCAEWRDTKSGFDAFLAYIGKRPSKEYSIDRLDPNGDYEPGNVQWATDKHQARNKRKSLFLPHPKEPTRKIPAAEVAEILGISYQQLRYRYIKEGKWPTTGGLNGNTGSK